MFNFEDYTKNFEKIMSQSPFKIDDALKSMMDYNAKVGKIALDTAKKNTELSQVWAKESLAALEPFVKGSEQLNQGTGLGLSIVQKLIKLNNGELSFQKSSHGGLKVTVILQI